ncbi:MAG TPA: di-heme oxidoredictase family protein [Polyangiaceae bacterium]|nr:di-heme oxidoredictase family protein [Polyangiaceae bacterium]
MNRAAFLGLLLLAHCSSPPETEVPRPSDGADPFDIPIDTATKQQVTQFLKGDNFFDVPFREPDGLGPLYIRIACSSCHTEASKGPGLVQKMVVLNADGTPSGDQSTLPFGHTVRPQVAAGATTPILPPGDPAVKTTIRVGPSVLGRGYLEAVDDSEIERVAEEQANRTDAIAGHVNRVVYTSEANPDSTFGAHANGDLLIGRFGLKARIATLDDFTADALQGDMGITNPLRPTELPNPDGLTDDAKPGVDVDADFLNDIANYLRLIAIPARRGLTDEGRQLFERVTCGVCHAPSLRTRADYPIAQLRSIDAPIYSDLLLHDMGVQLSDGIADGQANWRQWKTTPLIGLRFARSYLHDGRAGSIEEAIRMHASSGSEAGGAVRLFNALSDSERQTLIDFVSAL